jgi:predicted acylesterase/phospholipase RssA/CRP-like cAMP-binding protein
MMQHYLDRAIDDLEHLHNVREILLPVFGFISDQQWEELKKLIEWVQVPGGTKIIQQGEASEDMFFLVHGRLTAMLESQDEVRRLGDVYQGQSVGEIGVFSNEKRSASVYANRDSVLIKISKDSLQKLMTLFPDLMMNVLQTIIKRATSHYTQQTKPPIIKNVVLISKNKNPSIELFVNKLVKVLGRFGTCTILKNENLQQLTGVNSQDLQTNDSLVHIKMQQAIENLEQQNLYLILWASEEEEEWLNKAIRQADVFYIIKERDDSSDLTPTERSIFDEGSYYQFKEKHLVLIHKDGSQKPTGTSKMLANRRVDLHHHIRLNNEQDIQRVARHLSGKSVGIAFAGGGAKGLAHIGIIKELYNLSIPIDYFSGTSVGSLGAGIVAMDMPIDEMLEFTKELALASPTKRRNMNILPMVSLLKGKDMDTYLEKYYGSWDIEDLWINFSCVSSNLTKKTLVEFTRGSLATAIRASISLPGVFPPAVMGDDLLVDGGLMDNLPLHLLEKHNIAKKIVVSLHTAKQYKLGYLKVPDSLELLKYKLTRKEIKVPSMMTLLMESMVLSSYSKYAEIIQKADLHLQPPVAKIGLMQWHKYKELIEIGEKYTREKLTPEIISFLQEG